LIVENLGKPIEPYYKEYNIPDEEHNFGQLSKYFKK
jgi:hypothetical protein